MLTEKQEKDYLESPNHCPFCGSTQIDSGVITVGDHDDTVSARVECADCGKHWYDKYTITGVYTSSH